MRTSMVVGVATLAFAAGALVGWAPPSGKEPPKTAPGVPGVPGAQAEMSPEMKAMMAFATPGSEQARLAKKVGTWDLTVKIYGAPGAPPTVSKNKSTYAMEMGGRYLIEKVTGEAMGGPFEGMGITGYDNGQKRYEYAWVDTLSTAVSYGVGTADANGDLAWSNEGYDPMQGKVTKQRGTERMMPDGSMVAEMFNTGPDGKEVKVMELVYTRIKK